jgi:hypothetical protein
MRILPIAVALGLMVMAPVLAVAQSAKMEGRDHVTGPTVHSGQSAKMHAATDSAGSNGKPQSALHRRADK